MVTIDNRTALTDEDIYFILNGIYPDAQFTCRLCDGSVTVIYAVSLKAAKILATAVYGEGTEVG